MTKKRQKKHNSDTHEGHTGVQVLQHSMSLSLKLCVVPLTDVYPEVERKRGPMNEHVASPSLIFNDVSGVNVLQSNKK